MSISINLEGRAYLVCGSASGGIGGATARQIARAGGSVACVDLSQETVDRTIGDLEKLGVKSYGIVANLMDPAQTESLVENVVKKFGRLDGVANVAGGTTGEEWRPLEDTSLDMYRNTLNLNLEYVFRVSSAAARSWIKRDVAGAIVNVGSVSSITSAPYHGPYGAAKAGIAALTRTMAYEWGKYGIRANTVQPGAVMSERVLNKAASASEHSGKKLSEKVGGAPQIIETTTDEMANGILFLLSDLASGISGQTISIDSGMSTKFCAGARPFEINKRNPKV